MRETDFSARALQSANEKLAEKKARIKQLEGALRQIATRARELREGTGDWFELVEFEACARKHLEQNP